MLRPSLCLLAVLTLAVFGGCDTDNPSTPLDEIEGTYTFTELRFDPGAQAIADADVLARLVPANTSVEIFGTGQALIRFKLQDRPSALVNATAVATRSTVRITAAGEDEAFLLSQILLPSSFSLQRSPDDQRLSAQISTTANLQAFDPTLYQGLVAQPGTLYITLDVPSGE